jgi:crossover junction endonuclease MUS81
LFSLNLVTQVKRLPVGDGIWIARDRKNGKEYVLDLIIERKNVSDLHSSITDNRYRDQKLRLKVPSEFAITSTLVVITNKL